MFRLFLVSAFVAAATSHLCFISPHQRGSLSGENTAGADDCALTDGPCGGRKGMEPAQGFMGGMKHNFTLQRNLNHFNSKMPGNLTLTWVPYESDAEAKPMMLWQEMDANSTSPYLVNAMVDLPKVSKPTAVTIMATYNTNAASPVPAQFFQCADIMIM